jgi:hypothetical protein
MERKIFTGILVVFMGLVFFSGNTLAMTNLEGREPDNPPVDLTRAGNGNRTEVSGTVESLEGMMTTWMYGTHLLVNNETGQRYALKSDEVNLSEYNGESVTLKGIKLHDGIDTGPALIRVDEIEPFQEKATEKEGMDTKEMAIAGGILIFIVVAGVIATKF